MTSFNPLENDENFHTLFEDMDPFTQDVYHWMMGELKSSELTELYSHLWAVDYNVDDIQARLPVALCSQFKGTEACMGNLRFAAAWALSCYSIPNYSPEVYQTIVKARGGV